MSEPLTLEQSLSEQGPGLIDTHCHLDHHRFDEETDVLIASALAQGVTRFVTIGCASAKTSPSVARDLAATCRDKVRASAGVHPHDATDYDDALEASLSEVLTDPLVVAVGETGLDYYYNNSPREQQKEVFRRQIALAKQFDKPIIVHTRDAAEDTLVVLQEENAKDVGGIIHCFSEDATFAKRALDLGFISSFSGIVTFKNSQAIADAAKKQPRDAILVETDAPYLAPIPKRGKRNEPAFVRHTAEFIAELRGDPLSAVADYTTENAFRIFGAW